MRAKTIKSLLVAGAIGMLATLAGCAAHKVAYTVPEGPGEEIIAIKATNFRFEPNEVTAKVGSKVVLQVRNTSGWTNHNLTLQDPNGAVLLSLLLPAGQAVAAKVDLDRPGTYTFYCGKPFHSSMGMTGTIEVK